MDNEQTMTPERLAEQCLAFTKTEYGMWLLDSIRMQRDNYRKQAETFHLPQETKYAANERAGGISEVLALFEEQLLFAEHPEYFETLK